MRRRPLVIEGVPAVILVDTSVWIDHLRDKDEVLVGLLEQGLVVTHRFVIVELALGCLAARDEFLHYLSALPVLASVSHEEFMTFVERRAVYRLGIGLVDAHLLASALVSPGTRIWTKDRRLASAAEGLGLAAVEA